MTTKLFAPYVQGPAGLGPLFWQNEQTGKLVLCWALGHHHNGEFTKLLKEIEADMKRQGLTLGDSRN